MPTAAERIAYLEGQVQEYSQMFAALRDDIGRVGQRVGRVEDRLDRMEDRMSRHFTWLVGVQVTTVLAIVGALLARA